MDKTVKVVNIKNKLELFKDTWSPKILGDINDCQVKAVKLDGPFHWHHHEKEDEMFLVVKGKLTMHLRDKDLEIDEGEFVIIPRLVEHMPEAQDEVHVLLFEPKGTLNTGNIKSDKTVEKLERI